MPTDFRGKPARSLGGATRKEETREEVLRKAKEERAARQSAKQQTKAATAIQSAWRGHVARRDFKAGLAAQWVAEFSSTVADTSKQLKAKDVQMRVVAPLLALHLLPPLSPRRQAWLSASGSSSSAPSSMRAAVAGPPPAGGAPLRGSLALLLRSMASTEAASNYSALATEPQSRDWHFQARRVGLLCASVLGSTPSPSTPAVDPLARSAAARTLLVLTDLQTWRWAHSAEERLSAAAACRKLCASLAVGTACFQAVSGCAAVVGVPGNFAGDLQQQEAAQAKVSAASGPLGLLHTAVSVAVNLLMAAASEGSGAADGGSSSPSAAALQVGTLYSQHLLTIPNLVDRLPPPSRAKLAQPALLLPAMEAAAASKGSGVDPSTALWAAANLAALVVGPKPPRGAALSESAVVAGQGPAFVEAYLRAISALVSSAVGSGGGGRAIDPVEALWPLAERSHVSQLLQAGGSGILPPFVSLYRTLLGPRLTASLGPKAAAKALLPFLNCLAFAPTVLRHLWSWLAKLIGMPLEVQAGTTSGWRIESLCGGAEGLHPSKGASLGLFCRLLAHLLLVVDDDDFHNHQDPFSLSVSRAVATALNTLVFCTHVPPAGDQKQAAASSADSMLVEWAPIVLRSLYERDLRRPFCPASLWLAPYATVTQDGDVEKMAKLLLPFGTRPPPSVANFSAPAVVRALVNLAEGGPHSTAAAATSSPGPSAAQVPQRRGTGSATPSQLAALLLAAPHCVPFAQRVEVFRALIASEREKQPRGGALRLKVRRQYLLDDAFEQLGRAGQQLKLRLDVTFVNEQGLQEAGLDYGGLMKDFIEDVIKAGFNPDYGLFSATEGGQFFPGPQVQHRQDLPPPPSPPPPPPPLPP
mmetsp:Transcript_17431/g.48587  ORF Transcript_17431/g.48587 Transcript_17431/m.48587 type:complete len:870 (+) Transcript_17431:468-3077(+)